MCRYCVCLDNLAHIYIISMALLKLIRCYCVMLMFISKLQGQSQMLPFTVLSVCHCNMNCNNEKSVHQWIRLLLFHIRVICWEYELVYLTDMWCVVDILLIYIIAKMRYLKIINWLYTLILSLSLISLLCKTTSLL